MRCFKFADTKTHTAVQRGEARRGEAAPTTLKDFKTIDTAVFIPRSGDDQRRSPTVLPTSPLLNNNSTELVQSQKNPNEPPILRLG